MKFFFKLPPLVGIYAGCTVKYVTRIMKGDLNGSGLRLIFWLHNNS